MSDVFLTQCDSYGGADVSAAMDELFQRFSCLSGVKKGDKVVIKANLVAMAKPEKAVTTHPVLLRELTRRLVEKGAEVTVGDSPGGVYNRVYVDRVYAACGLEAVEEVGGMLNRDFSVADGELAMGGENVPFSYTAYLDKADLIINFCKLKAHGMMSMSGAVKNMFGAVPGTRKPEYHYRFPAHEDFAAMLVSLCAHFAPALSIVDAVVGMEGNGPTMGTPRKIGAVLASESPYLLDAVCARLIGLTPADVPTLAECQRRGLVPQNTEEISVSQPCDPYVQPDFDVPSGGSVAFYGTSKSLFGRLTGRLIANVLSAKPGLGKIPCRGCRECEKICPAKAIAMKKGRAVIDKSKCIRCFCCQEFCPFGAMVTKQSLYARLTGKRK